MAEFFLQNLYFIHAHLPDTFRSRSCQRLARGRRLRRSFRPWCLPGILGHRVASKVAPAGAGNGFRPAFSIHRVNPLWQSVRPLLNFNMMSFSFTRAAAALVAAALLSVSAAAAPTVRVIAGIDHSPWDGLLKKYVDGRGLVDYAVWQANQDDRAVLARYVAGFSRIGGTAAGGDEEIASLINAYNAFTIAWILENYPTESIRELDGSWEKARWDVGGQLVSLDDLENRNLRPLYGWKVHASIVCAARSCPPLLTTAYTARNLEHQTTRAFRTWLARDDLNQCDPENKRVRVSAIFKWFKGDFENDGDLKFVLMKYGPRLHKRFLIRAEYGVDYLDYHWGLNDQSGRGRDYDSSLLTRIL